MRVIFLITMVMLSFIGIASADELATREKDLHETLLDLSALVKAGVSQADFKKVMPELTVKFDRYVRSGGDRFGNLYDAVNAFRTADRNWDDRVQMNARTTNYEPETRYKVDQASAKLVQMQFEDVQTALDKYAEEKRKTAGTLPSQATSKPSMKSSKKASSKPDKKEAERTDQSKSDQVPDIMGEYERKQKANNDEHKARMEAIDNEYRAKQRDLSERRACLYTSPPTCSR